jgi:hypothetical protein
MGVSEKKQGDVSLRLLPEIKWSSGCISQSESRFRQSWAYDSASVVHSRNFFAGRLKFAFLLRLRESLATH